MDGGFTHRDKSLLLPLMNCHNAFRAVEAQAKDMEELETQGAAVSTPISERTLLDGVKSTA